MTVEQIIEYLDNRILREESKITYLRTEDVQDKKYTLTLIDELMILRDLIKD